MHHQSRTQKTGAPSGARFYLLHRLRASAKRPVLTLDQGNLGAFDADPSH